MFKSQQIFLIGILGFLGLLYNNCASKVQFSTLTDSTQIAFGAISTATNPPADTSSSTLTFNDLNEPATIAFNDNYPGAGDSDYNDFVVNINVSELYDATGSLSKIIVQYTPKYKLSTLDHKLILAFDGRIRGRSGFLSNLASYSSLPMFEGNANIDFKLVNAKGEVLLKEFNHDKSSDLIVYNSTLAAMNEIQTATITISNLDANQNKYALRGPLTIKRYRSVLNNGQNDIDISDINPGFVDQGGAPVGFFVPINWHPPKNGQSIFPAYPEFRDHARYIMSGQALESEPSLTRKWFDLIGDASLIL